jgi:hypothetical protein
MAMTQRRVEPPRGRSESTLRKSMLTQLILQGSLGVLIFTSLLLNEDRGGFRIASVVLFVVWLVAGTTYVAQFRALGSWRTLPVHPGEEMLWGTVASRIRPKGGVGLSGQFSMSTQRFRYRPSLVARLRGAPAEEWATESLQGVTVTPGNGRAFASGRWVVVETDTGDPVTLLTGEPRAVAEDIEKALTRAHR